MNILDLPGVESLRPEDVQQYLLHTGWHNTPPHYRGAISYSLSASNKGKVTVQVPLDRSFADYRRRMAELIATVADLEERSPVDVLADLLLPPSDAIHCRVMSELTQSGWIPLDDAIRLRQAQKQLLLACAHSELSPRAHFPRLAQTEATELLRSCREGPSMRGSYRTTLIVPVDPAVGKSSIDPFARRVTHRFMAALDETAHLCETQDAEGLLNRARLGVSANFLLALSELRPPGAQSCVELGVTWSRARPAPVLKRSLVRFSEGVFGLLAQAGHALRDKTPSPGVEVEGFVVRLERKSEAQGPGKILIAASLADRQGTSMVHVELERDDYASALDAHKLGQRVKVIGTLKVERRTLQLLKPTGFEVVESES